MYGFILVCMSVMLMAENYVGIRVKNLDVVNDFVGLINFGGVFIIFGSGKLKFLIRFVNMFL